MADNENTTTELTDIPLNLEDDAHMEHNLSKSNKTKSRSLKKFFGGRKLSQALRSFKSCDVAGESSQTDLKKPGPFQLRFGSFHKDKEMSKPSEFGSAGDDAKDKTRKLEQTPSNFQHRLSNYWETILKKSSFGKSSIKLHGNSEPAQETGTPTSEGHVTKNAVKEIQNPT